MSQVAAVSVDSLSYRYPVPRRQAGPQARLALDELSLEIAPGGLFAFLGPNGGGKTTLFRLLSTLVPIQSGSIAVLGHDLRSQVQAARREMGVVFQAASLDRKLTVIENIRHQAVMYGIRGKELRQREAELLEQLGLTSRAGERTEML